jgi:hypothetical protein
LQEAEAEAEARSRSRSRSRRRRRRRRRRRSRGRSDDGYGRKEGRKEEERLNQQKKRAKGCELKKENYVMLCYVVGRLVRDRRREEKRREEPVSGHRSGNRRVLGLGLEFRV